MRLLVACVAAGALLAAAEPVRIVREQDAFRVSGWRAPATAPEGGWPAVFQVTTGEDGAPPMLGTYAVEGGALVFRPRFPVAPGVRVRATFAPPGGVAVKAVFEPEAVAEAPSTHVARVYPSANELPANLLKFYVHFSAPMRRGEAWRHIRLLDERGEALELPFLEIEQELWDHDNRRLTVLFDPGRIKRGVLPREEEGVALEPGRRYTLVISSDWRDAQGVPLTGDFTKSFVVVEEDRTPLDTANWVVAAPRVGTREPLRIELPEPADHALLERMLRVVSVKGTVAVENGERRWTFVPDAPWRAGAYEVLVDTALEDLAGNRVGRPFDVDVFERVTRRLEPKTIALSFVVGH